MGCITSGHAVACGDRNRRGGIKNIWLGEVANVTGTTPHATDHSYTAIAGLTGTGGTGKNIWQFQQRK